MPVHIGTAGYVYPHWRRGAFYPSGTPPSSELSYYLSHFRAVEINATWHAFPRPSVLAKWRAAAPPQARLALKAPKLITHVKRLRAVAEDVRAFLRLAHHGLGPALGPVLFQCPPSLPLSLPLLRQFVEHVQHARAESGADFRVALEFRAPDWFCTPVFEILARCDIALVNNVVLRDDDFHTVDQAALPHCRQHPHAPRASWAYTRFHGCNIPARATHFPDSVLRRFAKRAAAELKANPQYADYSFFLNDMGAVAPKNARRYTELVAEEARLDIKTMFDGFVPQWTRRKIDIASFFKTSAPKGNVPVARSLAISNTLKPRDSLAKPPASQVGKDKLKPKHSPMKNNYKKKNKLSRNSNAKDISSFFTSSRREKG